MRGVFKPWARALAAAWLISLATPVPAMAAPACGPVEPGVPGAGAFGGPTSTSRDSSRLLIEQGLGASGGHVALVSFALAGVAVELLAGDATPSMAPAGRFTPSRRTRSLSSRGTRSLAALAIASLKRRARAGARTAAVSLVGDESASVPVPNDNTSKIWGGALGGYVSLVRRTASYAQVTSTFDEPRPGRLHHGYDIGLDAGTPVPVGWAGRVTKLTPWYNGEMCITVQVGSIEVNYGHLLPAVQVGQEMKVGDVVGHVAHNHVDIKMMQGDDFIDWGKVDPFPRPGDGTVLQEAQAHAPSFRTRPRLLSAGSFPSVK